MRRLYINANIPTKPGFRAMLIDKDRFETFFPENPSGIDAAIVDLGGAFVWPGFIDTHTHAFEGGLYNLGVDLRNAGSLTEVLERLRTATSVGGMIIASRFDETAIIEKRFPTRAELDRVQPGIPVLLRRVDGHSCTTNTAALKTSGLQPSTEPDDVFRGAANDHIAHWFHRNVEPDGIVAAYHQAAMVAMRSGATTVHTMIGDADIDPLHFTLIRDRLDEFPVEFVLYPQITRIETAMELGSPRIGGCILADGSFGSHTAALRTPYHDAPGSYGLLYRTDREWESLYREAERYGLQVCVHAIGDAAIAQLLRAMQSVGSGPELRHQIIHNELTDDALLDAIAAIGASAVMQPMFDALWGGPGGLYERVLGVERTRKTNRFRSILNRDILLTGGSDWYITDLDPIAGMFAAANHHNPEERISLSEALNLWTTNAAALSFDEDRSGRLEQGFQADFVVTDNNILAMALPRDVTILSVVKKGNTIFTHGIDL